METKQSDRFGRHSKGQNKKWGIVLAAVLVCGAVGFAAYWRGQALTLNEDELTVYQNAMELKEMMADPDYFGLTNMTLLKKIEEDGSVAYTYTILDYVGTDKYGSPISGEAIFKNLNYVMDYVKEPIKNDAEKMAVQFELKKYRQENGSGSLRAVVIDTEEIVEKLGLR